jgi:murein DD-endopeptidase MepM/ murein hydrolase activator NlpD
VQPLLKQAGIIPAVLAGCLLLALIMPVLANPIQERHQELDAVRQMQKQVQQKIEEYKRQERNLRREVELLEKEISRVQAEIRSLNRKIKNTEEQIKETEAELAAAEEQIDFMEDLLAVRLRAIYEYGHVSYLDVLFKSSTFTEFLTRYNDLQLILEQDRELLEEYRQERERIAEIKENLEERRQELLTLRRAGLQKKEELELKNMERELLLAAVRDELDAEEEANKQLEAEAKQLEEIIKKLQEQQRGAAYRGSGVYLWPVPEFGPSWITSGYGYRIHPITRRPGSWHGGIDIGILYNRWPRARSYTGTPVQVVAADSGIAYAYRMGSGYGNVIVIDHGANIATVYAHLDSFLINDNTAVIKGQPIGIVGSTGASTGPHLHFEVRINGVRENPLNFVK